jgi:hypothetical protein
MTAVLIGIVVVFVIGVWLGVACMVRDEWLCAFGQCDYDVAQDIANEDTIPISGAGNVMDSKTQWNVLRDELYATVLTGVKMGQSDSVDSYANTLSYMVDVEDESHGVDITKRHDRELTPADVLKHYESRDR